MEASPIKRKSWPPCRESASGFASLRDWLTVSVSGSSSTFRTLHKESAADKNYERFKIFALGSWREVVEELDPSLVAAT